MSVTDAQIAADYGPPCSGDSLRITLHGGGRVTVQPVFGDAVLAFDACLRAHNYRARVADTGGFACRRKKRPDGSFRDEWSTHAFKGTIDLNWQTNPFTTGRLVTDYPPGMTAAIEGIRTRSGQPVWSWGGRWAGSKDAMHWQPGCRRRDLVTGIDPRTVPGGSPPPYTPPKLVTPPAPEPEEAPMAAEILVVDLEHPRKGQVWEFFGDRTRRMVPKAGNRANLIVMAAQAWGRKPLRIANVQQRSMMDVLFERYKDITPPGDYEADKIPPNRRG